MKADLMDVSFFSKYLEEKGLAVSTITAYTDTLKIFLKDNPDIDDKNTYMKFMVKSMKYDMDKDNQTKEKNSYLNYYLLRRYIEWKFSDNIGIKNDLLDFLKNNEQIKRLKRQKKVIKTFHTFTDDELVSILNNLKSEKHQIMFIIQWQTGVRIGDLFSLQKKNAVLEEFFSKKSNKNMQKLNLSLVTKGQIPRVVTLFEPYITIVWNYIQQVNDDDKLVFIEDERIYKRNHSCILVDTENKKYLDDDFKRMKYNYREYRVDIKEAAVKAGINPNFISTHYLRRLFARKNYNKYRDVEKLKKALNHSDVSTSLIYLRDSGQDLDEMFEEMQNECFKG